MNTLEPHGLENHLNFRIKDQESFITGYGKHARIVACIPDKKGLHCRIDMVHGLPEPSLKDIIKVSKHYGDANGRWKLESSFRYSNNKHESIFLIFQKA